MCPEQFDRLCQRFMAFGQPIQPIVNRHRRPLNREFSRFANPTGAGSPTHSYGFQPRRDLLNPSPSHSGVGLKRDPGTVRRKPSGVTQQAPPVMAFTQISARSDLREHLFHDLIRSALQPSSAARGMSRVRG
jgi:hypothetical protein